MCEYFCIGFIGFMLAGKKLPGFTSFFLPITLKKTIIISKMNECNSARINKTKFRLSEITGIQNYFYQEINQRKLYIKKLRKYVTAFDYIDKISIVLSAATGGVSIIFL